MGRINKQVATEASCYDLALERLHAVFDRFDHVAVSFSGGKDSTVCLNLTLQVAREKNRLPLRVFSFDEEAIPPETVEYLARVAALPDVAFEWYCVPIHSRNACSSKSPHWYPWAPEDREKWVRELPPTALTDFPGFQRLGIADLVPVLYPPERGTAANIMGIRTQESMSRFRAIASKKGANAYMTPSSVARHVTNVYAIYDWRVEDVWRAPHAFGWDYNHAYDVMDQAGISRLGQRCAPPYADQPIRRLYTYKTCWPELWARMVERVPGAATAARYANTELYACGVSDDDLPPGMTWRDLTMKAMQQLQPSAKREVAVAIKACLTTHEVRSRAPMPDAEPDPLSGFCWKTLYVAAKIGGNKHNRQMQKMMSKAMDERRKRGITA